MNAINFIQKHSITQAKECLSICASPNDKWFIHEGDLISDSDFDDLKRLVESVELVGKVGGITKAKAQVKQAHEHDHITMSITIEINGSIGMGCLNIDTLEKAIADYEAIGGEHV